MNGIKKKILLNSCIIIFITVFVLESFFIFYVRHYYYNSIEYYLLNKAKLSFDFYNKYMAYSPFENKIKHIYKNLISKDEKTRIQVIDNNENVLIDSYGFYIKEKINALDVKEALKGNMHVFKYKDNNTKENIMSISIPLKFNEKTEGILRYSVSIEKINKTLINIELVVFIAGLAVLTFVLIFSLLLGKSIIDPITELKNAAKEMANGNYKVRPKKLSNDEIGELAQTFSYMAEEIQKSEQIKNEFISSVSHELRTPLTSIKGWSETLSYGGSEEEIQMGLKIIQDETNRLIKLVEELLDFSKLQGKNIKINIENVNLKNILEDVVNQFKVKSDKKNIDLSLNIINNIKEIKGDKNRLKQVFINLIENSLKFTKSNGYIHIRLFQNEKHTFIEIEDNGEGIEKQNIKKVMKKFYQENPNKSGSGLGLSISYEIIKLHGGEMEIESEKGKGTTVKIKL
ncbi:sensor histidine kinase [Tepidibacter thalassicus]|uniref:histidine kinase n=1 Tax=Tepidibacter thalassicus DSM 15285 TaxID=1123350 RepID=A0A1M5P0R7_9FIRM|nr:HAMP domain-containing sensor histidine kinase [Tepidibacter thalassicus]SHG95338.1 Signal transduction histidine kinase [Tepidibacter thalassicus DSM 15285]